MTMATGSGGNPFDRIWEAIYDLQVRVTSLEESTNTKTWHFVMNFTLSEEQPISPLFLIQGEKWRINWEPQGIFGGFEGFIIWDENGYGIEWVHIWPILEEQPDANGIHYVVHGDGSYYIQYLRYGGDVDFTIESYH